MWFYRKCRIGFFFKKSSKKISIKPFTPVILYVYWYKNGKGGCGELSMMSGSMMLGKVSALRHITG